MVLLALGCAPSAEVADFTETPPHEFAACSRASADICNGRDDDCDGAIDEDGVCESRCGAAQISRNCAIRNDGTLWCWGITGDGEARLSRRDNGERPFVQVAGTTGSPVCARRIDGSVWCSGGLVLDTPGQPRGDGGRLRRVKALGFDVVEIQEACALKSDGSVWCWGYDTGDGTAEYHPDPRRVRLPAPAVRIATAVSKCAQLATGELACWGPDSWWPPVPTTPTVTAGFENVHGLVVEGRQRCAIRPDGFAVCAGGNQYGQLCDGTTTDTDDGKRARNLGPDVIALSTSGTETCGLKADGVWCCGVAQPGVSASRPDRREALRHTTLGQVRALGFPCSITTAGRVICRRHFMVDPAQPKVEISPVEFDLCGAPIP
jgi:hypothetical protein